MCSVDECEKRKAAKGLCSKHYSRLVRTGTTDRGKRWVGPAHERFWAKVDKTSDPNGCWLWTAAVDSSGYGTFNDGDKTYSAHRVVWSGINMCPMPPRWLDVDHLCYVPACVNPEHLRLVTHVQNIENKQGLLRNNKSGYQGVSWSKAASKWVATVGHKGKCIHLGCFDDPREAAEVAKAARLKLQTHNERDRK